MPGARTVFVVTVVAVTVVAVLRGANLPSEPQSMTGINALRMTSTVLF